MRICNRCGKNEALITEIENSKATICVACNEIDVIKWENSPEGRKFWVKQARK